MATELTDRQRNDLHKSILDYLHTAGFTNSFSELRQEAPGMADFSPNTSSPVSGLLIKKWTSIIRMQRKIMDLEARLSRAQEEVSHFSSSGAKHSGADWLPGEPAKSVLVGHRDKINAVAFHPLYSVLASASVDASVRIWDWDTGELERSLKGHTKPVRDCKFDSAGKILATCSDDLFIKLWSVSDDYKNVTTLRGHEHTISSRTASRDKTIKLWDALRGTCLWTFVGHDGWVQALAFHPSGKFFLSVADDHTMRVWDLKTGRCLKKVEAHHPFTQCVAWAVPPGAPGDGDKANKPVMNVVATGGADHIVKIWRP